MKRTSDKTKLTSLKPLALRAFVSKLTGILVKDLHAVEYTNTWVIIPPFPNVPVFVAKRLKQYQVEHLLRSKFEDFKDLRTIEPEHYNGGIPPIIYP